MSPIELTSLEIPLKFTETFYKQSHQDLNEYDPVQRFASSALTCPEGSCDR